MDPIPVGPGGGKAGARLRLRDFQSALTARLQAARAAPAAEAALAVRVGALGLLVDLREVGEILDVAPWLPVPRTWPWYLGVANLRGRLCSVIDLACFCGAAPVAPDKDSRLITFAPGLGCNAALLVSRLAGLRHPGLLQPAGGAPPAEACLAAPLRDAGGALLHPVSLARLVTAERFLQIGREAC